LPLQKSFLGRIASHNTRGSMVSFVAVILLALAPGLAKAETLYGVTYTGGQLITIDPTTGAGTLVGTFAPPANSPTGLAIRQPNQLFVLSDTTQLLYQIDPATGSVLSTINIGMPPGALLEGDLTFRSDGVGFLALSFPVFQLWTFTPTAGSAALVGTCNPGMDGLAFNSAGVLYGLDEGCDKLYTINPATGATTLIGNTGLAFPVSSAGLAFDSAGNLYAGIAGGLLGGPSSLYKINPATGAATLVGPIGFKDVSGIRFTLPPPTPPGGGGGGSGGVGEGSYVGVTPPPLGGSEGSFAFVEQFVQRTVPPSRNSVGMPVLAGPFLNSLDGGLVPAGFTAGPPPGTRLQVFNVSAVGRPHTDSQQTTSGPGDLVLGAVVVVLLAMGVEGLRRALG
jgi:hypothetical protein